MIGLPHNGTIAKIISLIMAFALWLYVMNEQNPAINLTYSVVLEAQNLPGNLVLTEAPSNVRVKIRGPRAVISNIAAKDIKAFIDMQGAGRGEYSRKVHISVPNEAQLAEVSPETVTVRTDNLLKRTLPVDIKNIGQLPQELQIVSIAPSPNSARVSGAEGIVNKVVRLEALFSLDQKAKGEVKADVPLAALDQNGVRVEGVLIEPNNVTVTAHFIEKIVSNNVPVKVTFTGSLPAGYKLSGMLSNPPQAALKGSQELMAAIKEVSTEEVSLDGVVKDTVRKVRLQVPPGIAASPDVVEVLLKVVKE